MIRPLHVIHQVQEEQVPVSWSVFYPARLFNKIGLIFTGCTSGMTMMIVLPLLIAGITNPSLLLQEAGEGPFGQLPVMGPVTLLSLAISILIPIFLTFYEKRRNDAILILLPEGVLSSERFSNEAQRSFAVLEYANVATLRLKVTHVHNERLISLLVQYKNGEQEKWNIHKKYRFPEMIAQRVISDHLRFGTSSRFL